MRGWRGAGVDCWRGIGVGVDVGVADGGAWTEIGDGRL